MKYLGEITDKMLAKNVQLIPCNEKQVETLEDGIGKRMPECYREFLLTMGVNTIPDKTKDDWYGYSGFSGEDVFWDNDLIDMQSALSEQLVEDERPDLVGKLKDTSFLFFISQGYIFAFFDLDEGENPPVYGYIEGYKGEGFPILTPSLVEFYDKYLKFGESPFGPLNG